MGVPLLYSSLAKNYPRCVKKYKNTKASITADYTIDTLLIDGNACLHPVARGYYFSSDTKPKQRLCGSRQLIPSTVVKTDEECYQRVLDFIEELYLRVRPSKFVFAIDGVVNISKSAEQRKRRFLSSSLAPPTSTFDTTNISVGTPWMKKLHEFLVKGFVELGFKYINTNFIYQSYLNEGEGEHRLIDYIRNVNNDDEKCMIHANDADVIPLMLGLHRPNCYILRDRVDDNNDQCSVIDISQLRYELIHNYLPYCPNVSDTDKINSIIFIWYLVGNDFLPRCPSLEIYNNGLEDMATSLHKTMIKYGSIVDSSKKSSGFSFEINVPALVFWMKDVATRDIVVLQRKATNQKYVSDKLLLRYTKSDTTRFFVEEEGYKSAYNKKHFSDNLDNACKEFVNGLWWTFEYYTHKSPSWTWYYPYHYSPWILDIASFIESPNFVIPSFELGEPVPEELQLLYILPPKSFKLLPEPLRHLKDKYPEMFPTTIEIDRDGIENEWEAKVLLPFADFELLKQEYIKCFPTPTVKRCTTINVLIKTN